jgi:hypothetical protein
MRFMQETEQDARALARWLGDERPASTDAPRNAEADDVNRDQYVAAFIDRLKVQHPAHKLCRLCGEPMAFHGNEILAGRRPMPWIGKPCWGWACTTCRSTAFQVVLR